MFSPGERILAGVSGGADSVCLAIILREFGYDIAIAHVNHGSRGAESDGAEAFTRALAEHLSVPFFAQRVSIRSDTGNIVWEGRAARRGFFAVVVQKQTFTTAAVAHTRDDRFEPCLMNLFRGSGTDGLASTGAVAGTTVRPLIETTRCEVESYLRDRGQDWRTDQTNFDRRFARNRLRHDVIPGLAAQFNPRLVE